MRGDPESPLRWTCKSIRRLTSELQHLGYNIGATAVRFILYELDYSLQGNKKTREGEDHPDRNDQFLYINDQVKRFLQSGQPVISVDTKKRENIGNYSKGLCVNNLPDLFFHGVVPFSMKVMRF